MVKLNFGNSNFLESVGIKFETNHWWRSWIIFGLCVWSILHSAINAILVIQNRILNWWTKRDFGKNQGHQPTPSQPNQVNIGYDQPKNSLYCKATIANRPGQHLRIPCGVD